MKLLSKRILLDYPIKSKDITLDSHYGSSVIFFIKIYNILRNISQLSKYDFLNGFTWIYLDLFGFKRSL